MTNIEEICEKKNGHRIILYISRVSKGTRGM